MPTNVEQDLQFEPNTLTAAPVAALNVPKNPDDDLFSIRNDDYKAKILSRNIYGIVFTALLFMQNIGIGVLVWATYSTKSFDQLALILTGLLGVLVETYFLIRVMIQWLFTDINYTAHMRTPPK